MDRFLIKRKHQETETENCDAPTTSAADSSSPQAQATSAKRKVRNFRFVERWENGRPWLYCENNKMFCSYCKQFNKTTASNNKFVSGCESMRLENVRSHETSGAHKLSHSAFLNEQKSPSEQPIVKAVINMEKQDMELMKKLFTTAFFIGKHEKPYTDFVKLTELQAKNYEDEMLTEHYNSDKQAKEFIHFIARSESEQKLEKISSSEFIGTEVSTDSANLEQESYFVSYVDELYESHTDFVTITSVEGRATAQGLTDCFFDTFTELSVDVKGKCVQLGTDGPNVMKNMCKLVRTEIKWLLEFHCANHRLELSFKDAVKNLPLYNDVHSLLDGLYHFYDNSNLQLRTLKGTAELLGIKPLVHTTAKGTRWVAHRKKAVSAVDRNYAANVAQLQECNLDNTQRLETRAKALGLRDKLLDENLVIFIFAIFKDLLAIFSSLSCVLQSDDASIDTVVSMIRRTKAKLGNFDCEKEIKEFRDAHIKDGKFRDVQLTKNRFRHSAGNIVQTQSELLVNKLKQTVTDRFGPLGDGNIGGCPEMSLMSIFDVSRLPDCEGDDISQYGKAEIQQLVSHFSDLLSAKGYDPDQIEEERVPLWEYVRTVLQTTTKDGRSIKKFWPKILRKKGDSAELRNILSLVKILLVLIYSTAVVERGFSLMNRVKSDWRSRLAEEPLNDLMHVALSSVTVQNFNPEPAIKLWWVNAKKPSRPVDAYGKRPQPQ